jgi:Cu/Ag efflux protein CusF
MLSETGTWVAADSALISNKLNIAGKVKAEKQVHMSAKTTAVIASEAELVGSEQYITAETIDFHGKADVDKISLLANKANLAQESLMSGQEINVRAVNMDLAGEIKIGQAGTFEADETIVFTETSQIQAEQASIHLKAQQQSIKATGEIKELVVEAEHIEKVDNLIAGTGYHQHLKVTQGLTIETADSIILNQGIQRNCDVDLTAANVQVTAAIATQNNLHIETTYGDIDINANVTANKQLSLNSARAVKIGNEQVVGINLIGGDGVTITANGDVSNHGKVSSQKVVIIEADNLTNQSHGAETGIIEGNKIHIQTKGDVKNLCHEERYIGDSFAVGKDIVPQERTRYFSAEIRQIGECAESENSIVIDAGRNIVLDASKITADEGNIMLMAKQDIDLNMRARKYTASLHYSSNGKHLKSTTEGLDAQTSCIQAKAGRNQIIAEHGVIKAQAEHILSKYGSLIMAKEKGKSVTLQDYLDTLHSYEKKRGRFKITKSEAWSEISLPGIIANGAPGKTEILAGGDVDIKGHIIAARGKLILEGENVRVKQRVLNHWRKTTTTRLRAKVLGQHIGPGSGKQNVNSLSSPLATKLDNLAQSNSPQEAGLNTMNAGLEAAKTLDAVSQIESPADLAGAVAGHFGISPASLKTSIGFTQETHSEQYQTLAENGIDTDELHICAQKEALIEVPTCVSGDGFVEAKTFKQKGQALHYSANHTQQEIELSPKPGAIPVQAAAAENKRQVNAITIVNQTLQVMRKFTIKVHEWIMQDAVTKVGDIDLEAKKLTMQSSISSQECNSTNWQADTSGNIAWQKAHSVEQQVADPTRLEAASNITDSKFRVDEIEIIGSKILSDKKVDLQKPIVNARAVETHSHSRSQGFSSNLNSIASMMTSQGADAFSSANVNHSTANRVIQQQSVIYGAEGTNVNPNNIRGDLHTTSRDGKTLLYDKRQRLNADIPLNARQTFTKTQEAYARLEKKSPRLSEQKAANLQHLTEASTQKEAIDIAKKSQKLSNLVYQKDLGQNELANSNIKIVDSYIDRDTDTVIAVYADNATQQLYIAFKGTSSAKNMLIDDKDILLGKTPSSLKPEAYTFLNKNTTNHPNYKVTLTGHSLGAAQAAVMSSCLGHQAVVFDNPGIKNSNQAHNFSKVTNFQSAPNVVNSFAKSLGQYFDQGEIIQLQPTLKDTLLDALSNLVRLPSAGRLIHFVTQNYLAHSNDEIEHRLDTTLPKQDHSKDISVSTNRYSTFVQTEKSTEKSAATELEVDSESANRYSPAAFKN